MNIRPSSRNHGGALLTVMIFALIVAGLLGSYLIVVSNENTTVQRSENWNNSMSIAEAGVEEALAAINKPVGTSAGAVTNWYATITSDGWDTSNQFNLKSNLSWMYDGATQTWAKQTWGSTTGIIYHIKRWIDPSNGFYEVYINNSSTNGPEILSVGTALWHNGVNSATNSSRKVYLQTVPETQITGGIIAQSGVTFSGTKVTIDSWDSSTNTHSIWLGNVFFRKNYFNPGTNYGYWSNTLSYVSNNSAATPSRTANVHIFTDGGVLAANNANIAGYIETGPGGTESIKSGGYVGDLAWVFTSSGGVPGNATTSIQPGHYRTDANKNFFSYNLPTPTNTWQTTWLPIPTDPPAGTTNIIRVGGMWTNTAGVWSQVGGLLYTNIGGSGWTIGGNTYHLIITNRLQNTNWVYYAYNQISSSIFIDGQFNVIYVTNGFGGSGKYNFTLNTNADVAVWTSGDINAQGNATINNMGNYTHAFSVYDIAGNPVGGVNVKLNGNGAETGYYYMPSSHMNFKGGGSGGSDFTGAVICYDITIAGNMNFHYDQSIQTALPTDEYIPDLWEEVQ